MISYQMRETSDIGVELALKLYKETWIKNPVIIAIARSGIPIGCELSKLLDWPLDILSVHQLSMPGNQKEHLGAVTSHGDYHVAINTAYFGTNYRSLIERLCRFEKKRLILKEQQFRNSQPKEPISGRDIIIVDNRAITGSSLIAAIKTLEKQHPKTITVAAPYATDRAAATISKYSDKTFFLETTPIKLRTEHLTRNSLLDDSVLRYLLARAWSRTCVTSPESIGSPEAGSRDTLSNSIERYQWTEFTRQFSYDHKGWAMSGKNLATSSYNHKALTRPYSHGLRINDAIFIDIHYIPTANTLCFRYSTRGGLIANTICNLKNLIYRVPSPTNRSILIETLDDEAVYLGIRESAGAKENAAV